MEPHVKFKLGDIDPSYKGTHENHESAAAEIALHTASLAQLQLRLYAEGKRSLLIVLQGLDAAGKDGGCRELADRGGLPLTLTHAEAARAIAYLSLMSGRDPAVMRCRAAILRR